LEEFMMKHLISGLVLLGTALGATQAHAQKLDALNFGIISTESTQNLKPLWEPFLADMEKAVGIKVTPSFATDYAGVIEAMRFNKVQVAWYGNAAAIEAVDRSGGEIFAQSVSANGDPGYWSLIIVNKDSPIHSLEDIVKAPGKYTFGNGDPNSTSGFLVPSYYAWAQNNIDVRKHFTRVVAANHETNALAVANKQVDLATNNTESMDRLRATQPDKAALIREVWRSPLIPNDPIVWRKDLDPALKQKIKAFFMEYGVKGSPEEVTKAKAVLAKLQWAPFKESTDRQLQPIRETRLFRDRLKIEQDDKLSADDKKAKLAEIDVKLTELRKASGS
jgi:phosphonate transport system substrate-binding protein